MTAVLFELLAWGCGLWFVFSVLIWLMANCAHALGACVMGYNKMTRQVGYSFVATLAFSIIYLVLK